MIEHEGSKSKASEDCGQVNVRKQLFSEECLLILLGRKNPNRFPTFYSCQLDWVSEILASLFNLFSSVQWF